MIPPPQQIQRIPTPLLWWRRGKGYVFRNVRTAQSLALDAWHYVLTSVITKQDHVAQHLSISPDTRVTSNGRIRVTADGRRRIVGMVRYARAPRRDLIEQPFVSFGVSTWAYSGSPETPVSLPATVALSLIGQTYEAQRTMTRKDRAKASLTLAAQSIVPCGRIASANKPKTSITLFAWNYKKP